MHLLKSTFETGQVLGALSQAGAVDVGLVPVLPPMGVVSGKEPLRLLVTVRPVSDVTTHPHAALVPAGASRCKGASA